jgi:hypothetical protein
MEQLGFTYKVRAVVKLSEEEVNLLCQLAAIHYDARCRAAVIPGRGAFLNAAKVSLGPAGTTEAWGFTECDTAAKILESGRYLGDPIWMRTQQLTKSLIEAMQSINAENAKINSKEFF